MAAVVEKINGIGSDDQLLCSHPPAETDAGVEYHGDVRRLVDLFSKLNPAAKEFFPAAAFSDVAVERKSENRLFAGGFYSNSCRGSSSDGLLYNHLNRTKKAGNSQVQQRINNRVKRTERHESVKRTVYVSDVDRHVTEERLAEIFSTCGQVVDCRICGDPHSVLRFAFIEFSDEEGARTALNFGGTVLGYYPVKVFPSKTAILPVNPNFLPRTKDERDMVIRTIYCTNIDRKMMQTDVKAFFEQLCGQVSRLRILGDNKHSTRIAFVEFVQAESAILALNYSGMVLGSLPIRVSPSKTPVRPPRMPLNSAHGN
ncbi:polyadenylate-binding protein-interacting protein 11-like isoform X1 [Zingiber officinale]|uniref:polyadenylate-binding protein-interacting protein 11-like isoform X1 n=1 Tax=Zingiber officinale TaxID=94328 RepID=UPI001C4D1D35|nr:polyadenylate-binding protein-interacting protein 11-like isoform X1 [Zingiber officinale]